LKTSLDTAPVPGRIICCCTLWRLHISERNQGLKVFIHDFSVLFGTRNLPGTEPHKNGRNQKDQQECANPFRAPHNFEHQNISLVVKHSVLLYFGCVLTKEKVFGTK